ncbi:MAG: hypothetical protein KGM43_04905 [Planctomycetota bacterium]|nr:hypothetical protein [Planctomycetota bacterium]
MQALLDSIPPGRFLTGPLPTSLNLPGLDQVEASRTVSNLPALSFQSSSA